MEWDGLNRRSGLALAQLLLLCLVIIRPAVGDSSSPRLAAYYDNFMAICGDQVYEWNGSDALKKSLSGVRQVGVGRGNRYALTARGVLLVWRDEYTKAEVVMDEVASFHAGRSGLLIIRTDHTLWQVESEGLFGFGEKVTDKRVKIADNILTASVGDSANYYVRRDGRLYVKGRAHRGQYGDGKLSSSEVYVNTATDVVQVVAHTGHALLLKSDGSVLGTGGNIYGPLGSHGYGDKAISWGEVLGGVKAIATGSSHSLAIKQDGTLWIWGRNEGIIPKQVMANVTAVAAGSDSTVALSHGMLWQWRTGARPKSVMMCQ